MKEMKVAPARLAGAVLALAALIGGAGCFSGVLSSFASDAPPRADGDATPVVRACPAGATSNVRVESGLAYVPAVEDERQLDIAIPPGSGPHPLVVLVHGGGWTSGNRGSMRREMRALAREGYAAATVGYRRAGDGRHLFPTAVFDLRCALRWLAANADRFGIDPERIVLAGYSAGAHLASLVGVTEDVDGLEGPCPAVEAHVRGVISFAGPQDLRVRDGYTREQAMLVTRFLGAFPGDAPELAARASPVAHVAADAPAFLLVHGAADALVPIEQSREMQAELRRSGVAATVLELPDAGHRYIGLASSGRDALRCTVLEFLERTLDDE